MDVRVAHTSQLAAVELAAIARLLENAFGPGRLDHHDHEHALGGMHVLVEEDEELLGHAAVVQRRLLHEGRALRTGYVEGVAARADRRGEGVGRRLMDEVERIVRGGYVLGALSTSEEGRPMYLSRGWVPWRGSTFAVTDGGERRRTVDDDGGVLVLPGRATLDLDGPLACDPRDGDAW